MDKINASFELFGSLILWANVISIRRDKILRGASILPFAFYTFWGAWNLIYYPSVGSNWSAIAAVGVLVANATFLGHLLYYKLQEGKANVRLL